MNGLGIEQFDEYFRALHRSKSGPGPGTYPWQRELARRAGSGDWPGVIDLPTGSGKTACLDVAVFALAIQESLPVEDRSAPRRIFFCVNRRVIVDEAYDRARRIAQRLWEAEREEAESPALRAVAAALRRLAGPELGEYVPPLDVIELRGGIYRDNRWARSITQPTIVCTTIDQLGSRLLFRGYGVSPAAAPIQAALVAYDSLILLDEAHISEPFRQTLQSVRDYLDPKWSEQSIGVRPMIVSPMTATYAAADTGSALKLTDEDRRNPRLDRRLRAAKPARLREVADVVTEAVKEAVASAEVAPAAVGIIVNRVETAREIYRKLIASRDDNDGKQCAASPSATIELVIGSMRPIDRDEQAKRLRDVLGPSRPERSTSTSFVVATQCLEVGADYDFDVLITECASLDALRQRFGRLNRAGRAIDAQGVILAGKKSIKFEGKLKDDDPLDPIYGNALARTWQWLWEHSADGVMDLGIDALGGRVDALASEARERLIAPSALRNAPVMLPAYVDFWCQTSPRPAPDPDVGLFLHGPQSGEPDVQVCWRADLLDDGVMRPDDWCDVVSLLPPTSAECMSVPISRVKAWLDEVEGTDLGDALEAAVETVAAPDRLPARQRRRRGVLWRGAAESIVLASAQDLRPGDSLILPTAEESQRGSWEELGHVPPSHAGGTVAASSETAMSAGSAEGTRPIDAAERAFFEARRRVAIRLHPCLRWRFPGGQALDDLIARAEDDEDPPTQGEWRDLLEAAADAAGDDPDLQWTIRELAKGCLAEPYPDGRGFVLTARRRSETSALGAPPPLDDGGDAASRVFLKQAVSLRDHTEHVVSAIDGSLRGLPVRPFETSLRRAAEWHDLGKADKRFQAMLRREVRTDAYLRTTQHAVLLAKSDGNPTSREQLREATRRASLPSGFRHEMSSVQLAERSGVVSNDSCEGELALHVIAAHHGHARPLAPVVHDEDSLDVEVDGMVLTAAERSECPPHRLDSGIAERFWTLTRRFGWWGLAYLEAILRLADQQASAKEDAGGYDVVEKRAANRAVSMKHTIPHADKRTRRLHLGGLDGSNPLGFLAALGVLSLLAEEGGDDSARLLWVARGTWTPAIVTLRGHDDKWLLDTVMARLEERLGCEAFDLGDNMEVPRSIFMEFAERTLRECAHDSYKPLQFLAALGTDAVPSRRKGSELIQDSALRTMSGSGHQYMLRAIRNIVACATRHHVEKAMFAQWTYDDPLENLSLRWDPIDDLRHAVRWRNPSGDPFRRTSGSMLGANRLAVESLSLLPTLPEDGEAVTSGFAHRGRRVYWTWPIWRVPLTCDAVRSTLTLRELQDARPDRELLAARGIAEVYRCERFTRDKFRNFTPAQVV